VEERGHLPTPGAAVHRHILDRMNAINDSLKKKLKKVHNRYEYIIHIDVSLPWLIGTLTYVLVKLDTGFDNEMYRSLLRPDTANLRIYAEFISNPGANILTSIAEC